MGKLLKAIPIPLAGVGLALAALGNLVQSYGQGFRNVLGLISAVIIVLLYLKIITNFSGFMEEMNNPITSSVFATFPMANMLLATYLKPYAGGIAKGLWFFAIAMHVVLILYFISKFVLKFDINKVFPSWFIVFVGIVVASVSSPAFEMTGLGRNIFWFGLVANAILLAIVIYRTVVVKGIPEPAFPLLAIYSAPVALNLAGYMSAFEAKSNTLVYILLILSQVLYFYALTVLGRSLAKGKFFPAYAGFTFPLVISAISLKLTNGYFGKAGISVPGMGVLVKIEEAIAVVVVLYVLFKFIMSISAALSSES